MGYLKKIRVSTGIDWVEAPEADMRILCGCPADSIKHLMRRGLILSAEKNGVTFETGPNAILLADSLVQNGDFANLAEFPVLQMLYRQGIIIPGHPNNSGVKPLLIGLREQVSAQMQYIYRGSYGLVTEQEMLTAGATPAIAREMLALKMKFAYGKIRSPKEFLDICTVGNHPVEIRNGLFIRRLRVNLYEFSYRDETVAVDLQLPPQVYYESPYPLNFHRISRDYFSIIHSGEGDGWDINRPSMGSVIVFQGRIYLIDAGPNIQNTLLALGIGINEVDGIFHTHSHDDHMAGLTSLLRADHRIKYYATPLVRRSVTLKLSALVGMDPARFTDFFAVHDLEAGRWNQVDGLEVQPIYSPHPVETTVFYFRTPWENSFRSFAHLADTISLQLLQEMTTPEPETVVAQDDPLGPALLERVRRDYALPVDIKKLDIGRGMIHGVAEDFRDDTSGKLILAHTALPLSDDEKEIGSGAPFGTVDLLIPAYQDYWGAFASGFLRSYFPAVPMHQLAILLNNPRVEFNPQTIILKARQIPENLYLILSGTVETIQSEHGAHGLLYAGTLVGEIPGFFQIPSAHTFRTASFVQALRIPVPLHAQFINNNALDQEIAQLMNIREPLKEAWLFSTGISDPVCNQIAKDTTTRTLKAGTAMENVGAQHIYVIAQGRLERRLGLDVMEVLECGDFFNEETAVYETPAIFHFWSEKSVTLYEIPWESLRHVPIIQWKVFETHEKRKELFLNARQGGDIEFQWYEEYNVDVRDLDIHHQQLFQMGAKLYAGLKSAEPPAVLQEVAGFLKDYSEFHFRSEERILFQIGYPEARKHQESHNKLVLDLDHMLEAMTRDAWKNSDDFIKFFRNWLVEHILIEDRQYADFIAHTTLRPDQVVMPTAMPPPEHSYPLSPIAPGSPAQYDPAGILE
ncbi:MAG: bacteriohemerythrin [Magnetococcales bacterium]|nr:bacteriohemerythrin [Magnetococcales bacterium]MBF0321798.1 bacteriohemerythrin [Magnetococcales bacterium]